MVILGLGSNIGDRLDYLRQAYNALQKIPGFTVQRVSPVYLSDALLPENAAVSWDQPYLNLALAGTATLAPLALLQATKRIEAAIGRKAGADWGPRPIDIDILAWDDLIQYDDKLHIPHEHLLTRPFALWPLADVAPHWQHPVAHRAAAELCAHWGSRFDGAAPLHTRQIPHRVDSAELVGILNVTPDSFADAPAQSAAAVIEKARQLVAAGATVLDIGAEATNPQARALDAAAEWERLAPILPALLAAKKDFFLPVKISVDTRHSATAAAALDLGVDWINDVGGLSDPAMRAIIQASAGDVVMMHQLGIPAARHHVLPADVDVVSVVYQWAERQLASLAQMGIATERVIVDIGIGFGKTATQSLELLRRIAEFNTLPTRLLVGHSRKSFQTLFTDQPAQARDLETLPISLHLNQLKIDYLRVHNVADHARVFKVQASLS